MDTWVPNLLIGAAILLFMWGIIWLTWNYPDLKRNFKRSRRRCQNCHFLTKESSQLDLVSWDWEDREERFPRIKIPPGKLEHDDWSGYAGFDMIIGCHKEIWSQDHNEMKKQNDVYYKNRLSKEISRNRRDSCFFVPFHDGMSMENASQLFVFRSENRRNSRRILWTQLTSWLAILLSAVALYLQFAK